MKRMVMALVLAGLGGVVHAETLSGLCMVTMSKDSGQKADLMFWRGSCGENHEHCGTSENSNIGWERWSGVSPEALKQDGAVLKGTMHGEAGELTCSGTVHDGVLAGRYEFVASEAFAKAMGAMGFEEITPRKQEGMVMLDITTEWVRQMKAAGVTEMTTSKLMGLRALHVDPEYVRAMAAAGYPELRASKLTSMKAVGVTPEKARDARAMGFQPTEEELIQMSIFKIDRPFVEKMRARGLNDLTVSKLVKVKIFKLDN